MENIKEIVNTEIKNAMKAKDKTRLNVLRYIKKLFIENDTSPKPVQEMDIVISHAKKTRDSLSMYPEGSNQRVEIEAEIKVLEEFLPKQLTETEVIKLIHDIISEIDAPNMGMVMKELSPRIKGQFDGKKATELVKAALN